MPANQPPARNLLLLSVAYTCSSYQSFRGYFQGIGRSARDSPFPLPSGFDRWAILCGSSPKLCLWCGGVPPRISLVCSVCCTYVPMAGGTGPYNDE